MPKDSSTIEEQINDLHTQVTAIKALAAALLYSLTQRDPVSAKGVIEMLRVAPAVNEDVVVSLDPALKAVQAEIDAITNKLPPLPQ